jgi:hypothetical protein
MISRGKLHLFPNMIKGTAHIARIFKKTSN